jgi:hypothetical protein
MRVGASTFIWVSPFSKEVCFLVSCEPLSIADSRSAPQIFSGRQFPLLVVARRGPSGPSPNRSRHHVASGWWLWNCDAVGVGHRQSISRHRATRENMDRHREFELDLLPTCARVIRAVHNSRRGVIRERRRGPSRERHNEQKNQKFFHEIAPQNRLAKLPPLAACECDQGHKKADTYPH